MSDDCELERLARALRDAPPPDPGHKARALARAMENFDALHAASQENAAGARHTPEPSPQRVSPGGLAKGVFAMLQSLTPRTALVASTAIVAVGIGFLTLAPQMRGPGALLPAPADLAAPAPQPQARPKQAPTPRLMASDMDMVAEIAPAMTRPATTRPAAGLPPMPEGVAPLLDVPPLPEAESEAFANADPNPLKITAEAPVSTFSIDVDTASWAMIRNSLSHGRLPPPEAVRIEEMINYFPYDYPAPAAGAADPLRPTITVFPTPWNPDTQLVHIAIQGKLPAREARPPLNLVFLVDTSGSMQAENKLPLLKQGLRLMLDELRPDDQIAIVTYAGDAGVALPPTPARERGAILATLDGLAAGGATAGAAGLVTAYELARQMTEAGEVGRILLATDGDFNVGLSDPEALADFIADQRAGGIYLSVLGFGRGNLDDATMQALAQNGNGQAAYIDTLSEARKVLVDQLTGTLFPLADDVKVQVEFNPAQVVEYRLIGYETRLLARTDFNDDRVDAGEVGAGHQVTALYEITPAGSPAQLSEPLRYQPAPPAGGDEAGYLKLRYKLPGQDTSRLIEQAIPAATGAPGREALFAAAIAGFGQLLRGDDRWLKGWGYAQAIELAAANRGPDPYGYRAEAVTLMRLADSLSR